MEENLIKVCYEGSSGESNIRTMKFEEILYFSLSDIFVLLNKENSSLGEKNPPRYIPNLIKSQLEDLDGDEYIKMPHLNPSPGYETEIFVTQPGLNRVMGSDKSAAGRKFQRWIYHEVVPSITKHGSYPAPQTPQGSALAQMAEIVAQNSRALADSIVRQDKLEEVVNSVKGDMHIVQERVAKLELTNVDEQNILSVREWFERENTVLHKDKEFEIVVWCENLSLRNSKPRTACPSGERLAAKFYLEVIIEARSLVERARN